jgi:hypothetical protein
MEGLELNGVIQFRVYASNDNLLSEKNVHTLRINTDLCIGAT